jgi:hypothetical protein
MSMYRSGTGRLSSIIRLIVYFVWVVALHTGMDALHHCTRISVRH